MISSYSIKYLVAKLVAECVGLLGVDQVPVAPVQGGALQLLQL